MSAHPEPIPLPDRRPDGWWLGRRGPFPTLIDAHAARRDIVVCKYCGGMFGIHLPSCYRPRKGVESAPRPDYLAYCEAAMQQSDDTPVLGPPSVFKFSEPPKRLDGNGNEIRGSKS
jgi:hypothetical protein